MKTVTTYAEKKAKQILNLLQGYTKGIRFTAILILLLMGVNSAWGNTTFQAGEMLFYDFSAITGGANWSWNNGSGLAYDPNAQNSVKAILFTAQETWTTGKTIAKTNQGSWANITFKDRTAGTNCIKIGADGKSYTWTTHSIEEDVLSGKYIMVYGGELKSWSQSEYWFLTESDDERKAAVAKMKLAIKINNEDHFFGPVLLPNNTTSYIHGHWNSGLKCSVVAGSAYVVRNTGASTTYFTSKQASGSNAVYQVKKQSSSPTTTLSPTCPTKILQGEKLPFSHGAAGVSVVGNTNTVKYYLQNGNTYTEKTLTDGTIDVSDLPAGNYSIITLLYDGYIYVKASTSDFTIESAYDVTFENDGNGTTNQTGTIKVGSSTGIVIGATPSTDYEFKAWESSNGGSFATTVTNASNTFYPTANTTLTATFRSTATNSLTVVAGNGISQVAGSQDPVTLGSTYDIEATPKTGYTFSTWTANPAENATFGSATTAHTNVTVKNGSVIVTASATENMSTLTTSNQYDAGDPGYEVPAASVNSIGYETTATITATNDDAYTLTSWTLTNCTRTDGGADNATTITVRSNGDGKAATVTANYTENPCVYFINTARWTNVYIHTWVDGGDGTTWPGTQLSKVETINGYDVYKYVRPSGKSYNKVIFNNGAGTQTANLEWVNGKYYIYYTNTWVDRAEIENHLPSTTIYFKNNPKWTKVYVYFLTGENYGNLGASSSGLTEDNKRCCAMTQIGTTDVWKYDYGASGVVPGNVIAFTEAKQPNYGNFHNTKAAYRTDFNSGMELFIPQEASNETKNGTKYYSKGLWMKYNSTKSGYELAGTMLDNDWNVYEPFTASAPGNYHFDIALSLSGNHTYEFKVKNIKNDWYGKLTTTIDTTQNDLVLEQGSGDTYNIKLTTTSAGNYIFSIDLSEGTMKVSVEYPLMVGDYRMVYIESETKGTEPYTKFHPAQSIRGITDGEKLDTVSFFINKTNGENPAILLQRCSNINGATITWEDIAIQYINGNGGANPVLAQAPAKKSAEVHIGNGCPAVTKDAVYNFVLEQTNTGSHKAQILAENTHLYEGNYYIRTDGAKGGWRKYLTNPDNIMTHSQTALTHGGYDYYFCKWVHKDQNVQYVVANDYSYCVSDTLTTDAIVTNNGILPANANVRYTWNSSTNALARAYLSGSSDIKDRYLVLVGDANLQDLEGQAFNISGLNSNEANFKDMGNWQYQLDVKADQNTQVKLTADYNGKTQYFIGNADSTKQLIKGTDKHYALRLIYDFKTNYLVSGLVGNQTITGNLELEEVMIIRSHHEEAQTVRISGEGSVTANKAYGVMTFNKSTLNGAGSEHERALYWVSFPFDVKLDEAFGFGNYGEHWIMEYYDGKERAEKGLWKEPTYSYWKYITDPTNYTLKAGQGYVLCLDLDLLGNNAEFWKHDNAEIALYFPSNGKDAIVINDQPTERETIVPEHECTIIRDNREIEDSNWNIIGVPAYTKIAKIVGENISYYQYNAADNTYVPDVTPNFNTMHAYMVQYAGTINWTEQATSIAALAARKSPAGKDQYTLRLALQQEDAQCDHTFIRLQEDNATAEFDMNYDLCKIINGGANIYSMIGNVEVAANVLPVEERVIPLGLDIHETGNYTFAMPDGTDGITATLIDYETGTETNLLLADYTTELREGTNNERFALRVRPNHVATEVENTIQTDGNDNVKKYIIDGALYLLRDGKLYDAQGRMVQQ